MRAKENVGRGLGKLLHIENTMYTNTDINYDDIFEEARKELKIED